MTGATTLVKLLNDSDNKGDTSVTLTLSQGPKQKTKEPRLSFMNYLWDYLWYLFM